MWEQRSRKFQYNYATEGWQIADSFQKHFKLHIYSIPTGIFFGQNQKKIHLHPNNYFHYKVRLTLTTKAL